MIYETTKTTKYIQAYRLSVTSLELVSLQSYEGYRPLKLKNAEKDARRKASYAAVFVTSRCTVV
jgi:hypothetical protein